MDQAGLGIPREGRIDSAARLASARERGVLGAFMFDLGGGVMIHGTPQENLLGRSVTHGCIRVGYDDLKVLYDSVQVGTKVFIF